MGERLHGRLGFAALGLASLLAGCIVPFRPGDGTGGTGGTGAAGTGATSTDTTTTASTGTGGACGGPGEVCCDGGVCNEPSLACDGTKCSGCIKRIVAGHQASTACATNAAGTTRCWGDNTDRQLTCSGSPIAQLPTTLVQLGSERIEAASLHMCASTSAGSVHCWGYDERGQTGADPSTAGTVTCPGTPIALPAASTQVAISKLASIALRSDGTVYGWGDNSQGQLSIGGTSDLLPHPVPVALTWAPPGKAIAAANSATCVLANDKTVTCAGSNADRELGTAVAVPPGSVVQVPLAGVEKIASSTLGFCALNALGEVWCWGNNERGLLGNLAPNGGPTQIGLPGKATHLSVGFAHACAILADDSVVCWGENYHGSLGFCGPQNIYGVVPVYADGASKPLLAKDIALGTDFSCVIDLDDRLRCWGTNAQLEVGVNGGTSVCTPTLVPLTCD